MTLSIIPDPFSSPRFINNSRITKVAENLPTILLETKNSVQTSSFYKDSINFILKILFSHQPVADKKWDDDKENLNKLEQITF